MEIKSDLRVDGGISATPTLSSDLSQLSPLTGELRLVDGEWLKYNGSTFESISTLGEIDNDSNQIDGAFVIWDGTAGQFITDTSIIAGPSFPQYPDTRDDGPTRDALYTDATGALKRGRITNSFAKVRSNGGSDNLVNLNQQNRTALSLTGDTTIVGTDFTISASGEITCNFTGFVRADYVLPHTSTGERLSLRTEVERERGGSFSRFAVTHSYIRGIFGHLNDTNAASEILACQTGDIFRIVNTRSSSNTAASNITRFASFSLERIYD